MTDTSPGSDPWWASNADRVDPDEDPLGQHRQARHGADPPHGPDPAWNDALLGVAGAIDRLADAVGQIAATGDVEASTPPSEPAARHAPDTCGVCPLCTVVRAVADTRPDLLDHLAEASRHVAAAVRTLADAPATEMDAGKLQRIDLDGAATPPGPPTSRRS